MNKTKKPIIKRMLAGLLVLLMSITPLMPWGIQLVMANPQGHVQDIGIFDESVGGVFQARLTWTRPPAMGGEGSDSPLNHAGPHRATHYGIDFRDLGIGQTGWQRANPANPVETDPSFGPFDNYEFVFPRDADGTFQMQPGRLFEFRIWPWHLHTVPNPAYLAGTPGAPPYISSPVTPALTLPLPRHALYLTDIQVQATGIGGSITVEWSNPGRLVNGMYVFPAFAIFFEQTGGAILGGDPVVVHMDNVNLERFSDQGRQMFRYTVQHDSILVGTDFTVAVEPMVMLQGTLQRMRQAPAQTVFPAAGQPPFFIGGQQFQIAFRPLAVAPFQATVPIMPELRLYSSPPNHVRLEWSPLMMILNGQPMIQRVVIERSTVWPFPTVPTHVGTIESNFHINTTWRDLLPPGYSYVHYRLVIHFHPWTSREPLAIYATYIPPELQFSPTRPAILGINGIQVGGGFGLNITWQAFERPFVRPGERLNNPRPTMPGPERFLDLDVVYDIWITNDMSLLADDMLHLIEPVVSGLPATTPILGYMQTYETTPAAIANIYTSTLTHTFGFYSARAEDGTIVNNQPIRDNEVYFIRIIARRNPPHQDSVSVPAYGSYFFPPFDPIGVRPPIMSRPPLRIVETGLDYITIEFLTQWLEIGIVDEDGEWRWHSEVAFLPGDPRPRFPVSDHMRDSATPYVVYEFWDWTQAYALTRINASPNLATLTPLRTMQYGDGAQFDIFVMDFDMIRNVMDPDSDEEFEQFVEEFLANAPWVTNIAHAEHGGDETVRRFTIRASQLPGGTLRDNTTYGIFFRPRTVLPGGQWMAWWPTLVAGTTADRRPPIAIRPAVPVLHPHAEGDTWLEIRFRWFPDLEYELRFAELMGQWPDGGLLMTNAQIISLAYGRLDDNYPGYRIVRIPNLFPDTMHFIWMQARDAYYPTPSGWSNPIAMRTLDLENPIPPEAFGLASRNSLRIINVENDRDFQPAGVNYLILEWLRHYMDTREPLTGITGGAMGSNILGSSDILHSYLVQITGLRPNQGHYVRARTVLTVWRSGVGAPIIISYSYIVQVATNPDFVDAITVFVPPAYTDLTEGIHRRVRLSDWTQVFYFFTDRDDSEFDTAVRPELFPLPDHDFEIIYNRTTSTLLFRFRSNRVDARGNRDNLVDQRFISRLIQNQVFDYRIDLTEYDRRAVQNRVIEIPFSIIRAFEQRQITLTIVAGASTYAFAPGFANSPEVNTVGFGQNERVQLAIHQANLHLPLLAQGESYITTPQRVEMNIVAPHRTTPIRNLGAPMRISQAIPAVAAMDLNVTPNRAGGDDSGWARMPGTFDQNTNRQNSSTTRLGIFAAIGSQVPHLFGTDTATANALYFVNSVIRIDDLMAFSPGDYVNAWQINKLIAAAARRDRHVAINQDLTPAEFNSLANSGMLVPGAATVNRDGAMAGLVRLYEVRSRHPVTGYGNAAASHFADIANGDEGFRRAMLQAEHLGFLNFAAPAAPNAPLTFAELLRIMEIILRNS